MTHQQKFKQKAAEAKKLYKSGRYKTYADAVKAAWGKTKKVGSIKIIQKGESKNTPAKKVLVQKRSKTGTFKGYQRISGVDSLKSNRNNLENLIRLHNEQKKKATSRKNFNYHASMVKACKKQLSEINRLLLRSM